MAWVDPHGSKRSEFEALAAVRMDPRPVSYITDPDDFCRRCDGTGYERFRSVGGLLEVYRCDLCGGTGHRSVMIS